MAFKFIFGVAFIATSSAGYAPVYHYGTVPVAVHTTPVGVAQKVVVKSEEYDPHPQYKFFYGVDDKLTGDSKSQMEERDGDVVHGEYSLIDSDGYKRTVQYTSDPVNGFNAVVNREPPSKSVAVAPVAHYAAPVSHDAAPVAHYAASADHYATHHSAPVAHYAAPVKTVAAAAHYSVPVNHYYAPAAHYAHLTAHYTAYAAPGEIKYHH